MNKDRPMLHTVQNYESIKLLTNVEGSNGMEKCRKKMEIICSYPSPTKMFASGTEDDDATADQVTNSSDATFN